MLLNRILGMSPRHTILLNHNSLLLGVGLYAISLGANPAPRGCRSHPSCEDRSTKLEVEKRQIKRSKTEGYISENIYIFRKKWNIFEEGKKRLQSNLYL